MKNMKKYNNKYNYKDKKGELLSSSVLVRRLTTHTREESIGAEWTDTLKHVHSTESENRLRTLKITSSPSPLSPPLHKTSPPYEKK